MSNFVSLISNSQTSSKGNYNEPVCNAQDLIPMVKVTNRRRSKMSYKGPSGAFVTH